MIFKHIKDIFPIELHNEIKEKVSSFTFNTVSGTVSPHTDINEFNELIASCSNIQDVKPNICVMYNNYLGNGNFTSLTANQIFEAFKYYMPTEFEGYKLRRLHANVTYAHPDYPPNKHTIPHYDSPLEHDNDISNTKEYKTILYYVNESDGNTVLFNQMGDPKFIDKKNPINLSNMNITIAHEQQPMENSVLIYSSNRLHAQRPNILSEKRFVINIVLEKI